MFKKSLKKFPVTSPLTGKMYKVKIKPFRIFWSIAGYEVYIYKNKELLPSGSEFFGDIKKYDFISMAGIAIICHEEKEEQYEIEKKEKLKIKKERKLSKMKFEEWDGKWKIGFEKNQKEIE